MLRPVHRRGRTRRNRRDSGFRCAGLLPSHRPNVGRLRLPSAPSSVTNTWCENPTGDDGACVETIALTVKLTTLPTGNAPRFHVIVPATASRTPPCDGTTCTRTSVGKRLVTTTPVLAAVVFHNDRVTSANPTGKLTQNKASQNYSINSASGRTRSAQICSPASGIRPKAGRTT